MEKRERIQINKIRSEYGDITPDTTEIQKKKKEKGALWTIICQQIEQPIIYGQFYFLETYIHLRWIK